MQFIKDGFSYRLKFRGPVWQQSFTNHRVRESRDYENHREYIRMNPVRARLANRPEDYPYSSSAGVMLLDPPPHGLKPAINRACLDAALKGRSSTTLLL